MKLTAEWLACGLLSLVQHGKLQNYMYVPKAHLKVLVLISSCNQLVHTQVRISKICPGTIDVDISHHYNGLFGWFKGYMYQNPTPADRQRILPFPLVPLYFHRDALGRVTWRAQDLLRYISPSTAKPYRMLVQASGLNIMRPGDWRRRRILGNAPIRLQLASWALNEKGNDVHNSLWVVGRSILIIPAIFLCSLRPDLSIIKPSLRYPSVPYECFEYPKHVLNQMDAGPGAPIQVRGIQSRGSEVDYLVRGELKRPVRPRAVVAYRDGCWVVVENGSYTGPYIFISFAASHFVKSDPTTGSIIDMAQLDDRARKLAIQLGMPAYWIDIHCRAKQQPEATDDVHRFCDVVRGAHQVCIILPDKSPQSLVFYGQRLWCLPEVLLARYHKVSICTPDPANPSDSIEIVDIMDMVHRAWAVRIDDQGKITSDGNEEIFRLLVEHITGSLALSRLEYIQVALTALRSRQWVEFQRGDLAYALMTLMSKRPRMDPTDSEHQALARLFMAYDSDHIIERMACMDEIRTPETEN